MVTGRAAGTMAHHRTRRVTGRLRGCSSAHAKGHQEHRDEEQELCEDRSHGFAIACHIHTIQSAIPIIIKFSVSDTKPSGTLLDPPTQAHLSSRLSI